MGREWVKGNILIIDDEEGIRMMLENKLFHAGYRVAAAASGKHALQKIQSGQKFDLILCDLRLPGMTGTELYKELKRIGKGEVPFLIITGYPERAKIVDAINNGVTDVILKPMKHNDLLRKISSYICPVDDYGNGEPMAA